MTFEVQFDGIVRTVEDQRLPDPDFKDFVTESFRALASAHGVTPSRYSASAGEGTISVSIHVVATSSGEALDLGSGAIRTAFHVADGHTPGWKVDWCTVRLAGSDILEPA